MNERACDNRELSTQELTDILTNEDGVTEVSIRTEVEVTIARDEVPTDDWHTCRERQIPEHEMAELANMCGWDYLGEIDLKSDYRVVDKLEKHMAVGCE